MTDYRLLHLIELIFNYLRFSVIWHLLSGIWPLASAISHITLHRLTGADQVSVAISIIYPAHRRPKLILLHIG